MEHGDVHVPMTVTVHTTLNAHIQVHKHTHTHIWEAYPISSWNIGCHRLFTSKQCSRVQYLTPPNPNITLAFVSRVSIVKTP